MSDTNPSLDLTAQSFTSMLRSTQANINIDQAAASLLTGCQAPAVQSSTTTHTSVPFDHPQSKDPNINYSTGQDSFD